MKKILFLSVLFFIFLTTNSFALFIDVTENPSINYGTEFNWKGADLNIITGAFQFDHKANNAGDSTYFTSYGFCIQAEVSFGSYTAFINENTTEDFKKAAWIFENYWNGNGEADFFRNSGIQLAIWRAIYGNAITPIASVATGDPYDWYKTITNDLALAITNGEIASFDTSGYREIHFDDYQNMITTNPVPEPATMALFSFGLLGVALVGRKRR